MLKILKYFRKREWLYVSLSFLCVIFQVWLNLKLPDYMSEITTLVQTEGSAMGDILSAAGMMLICAMGAFAITFVTDYFVSKTSAGLSMRLREAVFDKTMSFSMEEINHFSTASLITRSINDITQVTMFVMMGVKVGGRAPIMAVWAIIKMYGKNWKWTAATGVFVCILLLMLGMVFTFAIPKFAVMQKLTDRLNRVTRENLAGIRVVRAYNAEEYQENKFADANDELTRTNLFTNRLMAVSSPGMQLIMSGLTLAIYWIGVYAINGAEMNEKLNIFSDMIVFSSYATQVITAFMILTMILMILPRAVVSAKRINEVLDTESKIIDGLTEGSGPKQGELEFRHVSFRYPDAVDDVLHDISFTAHKGETVAFIGTTGSGKSTLMSLIPRFYDVSKGEVLVDGINVKDYKQEALRNKLSYVPQKTVMFSGTVSSNVAYGSNGQGEPSEELMRKSLNIARAAEFVEKMEGTYAAPISQGGTNISGGQKQRLAIARAVCRRPEIYVFDDSFSALDYKTDRILRNELKKETADATTLIVAQRIGTIMDADKIIVLNEGKIVGQGKHKELLKSCRIYQEIAQLQLGEEALVYA